MRFITILFYLSSHRQIKYSNTHKTHINKQPHSHVFFKCARIFFSFFKIRVYGLDGVFDMILYFYRVMQCEQILQGRFPTILNQQIPKIFVEHSPVGSHTEFFLKRLIMQSVKAKDSHCKD